MKNLILVILGAFSLDALPAVAQESTQTLQLTNLDKKKGKLYIGWYNNETDFMKPKKAVIYKIVPVDGKEQIDIPFDKVKPGVYAIGIFLDENENGKLDQNGLGIPKEDYGFSNNVRPLTRAANFEEAKFEVKGKSDPIVIKMK